MQWWPVSGISAAGSIALHRGLYAFLYRRCLMCLLQPVPSHLSAHLGPLLGQTTVATSLSGQLPLCLLAASGRRRGRTKEWFSGDSPHHARTPDGACLGVPLHWSALLRRFDPPLCESLKALESVVDEDPVLVTSLRVLLAWCGWRSTCCRVKASLESLTATIHMYNSPCLLHFTIYILPCTTVVAITFYGMTKSSCYSTQKW